MYSLRQGIDDGFLAPYRVHRIVSNVDAAGWRPTPGEVDRYGREIPDALYGTPDFDRLVALKARTEAIARNLTDFLKKSDRFAKTIVFCVDQEHAEEMRRALNNFNAGLVKQYPDYVARIVSDEQSLPFIKVKSQGVNGRYSSFRRFSLCPQRHAICISTGPDYSLPSGMCSADTHSHPQTRSALARCRSGAPPHCRLIRAAPIRF